MRAKSRLFRCSVAAVALAGAACRAGAGAAALPLPVAASSRICSAAEAGHPFQQQQRPFEGEPAPQADYSRAPAPKKPDPTIVPTASIVVMGDAMADWLAYGLEDAFSDAPEIAIVRDAKRNSGLLRYEFKSDLDWWHVARDLLARQKADYVVMMLGVSDKQNIREKDLAKEKDADPADAEKKPGDDKTADKSKDDDDPDNAIIAPEPQGKKANGVIEFRSDQWAEIYSRRIDATVAALKSKGVPVFWVGLPAIRGPKATADAVYLNDLYRARAERAGAVYVDVWDGFVDEAGKFTTNGPRLRGSGAPPAHRRRRLFHQGRRPQARALRRARDPPLHEQPRVAGGAADRSSRAAAGRKVRRAPARRPGAAVDRLDRK